MSEVLSWKQDIGCVTDIMALQHQRGHGCYGAYDCPEPLDIVLREQLVQTYEEVLDEALVVLGRKDVISPVDKAAIRATLIDREGLKRRTVNKIISRATLDAEELADILTDPTCIPSYEP